MNGTAQNSVAMVKHSDRFFIGGKWVAPSSDKVISVITPATEELLVQVAEAQEADINRAVAAARQAFDYGPWPRMSPVERGAYLSAAADALAKRVDQSSRIWTMEMGIVHSLSAAMSAGQPHALRFYGNLAGDYPFIERHKTMDPSRVGLLVREAVGVVAAIIPWNAAMMLMINKIAPALLAGCAVIVKSSPESPLDAYIMAEVMEEIGLPDGVFNVVTADREVSELLVRHPGIDKVSFTGSTAAGKKIASICGERIARCTLELGGKSAAVVLDDYDVEKVAATLTQSTCLLSGQVCASLSRVIVPRASQDAFVDALSASFKTIRVGDPMEAATQMGPLAMERQRARVEDYIAKGISGGATLATGGQRPRDLNRGYFIEPTIFADVKPDAVIAQEEIFGPVLSVIAADNEEQAIEIANGTNFGLNSAVFSNDLERAYQVGRRLRAGTVGHNSFQSDFGISFGGFKQSGIGREGGREGMVPYLEAKTMIMDAEPAQLEMNPPK